MKKLIIETVSPNGSWSSNLAALNMDKSYMEYMKLCDIIPGKKLHNKFIIMPSYKSYNTLLCLYFVYSNESLDVDEFTSKLTSYIQDPRRYDAKLKLAHLQVLDDESAVAEDDACIDESALSAVEKKENERVYEETGYEITGRSPRKSSVASSTNPKYITRGSFTKITTGVDTTDIEVEKKLIYLMGNEYFSNFNELETLKNFNLVFFETPNNRAKGSDEINKNIIESLKKSHIEYSFTEDL